MAELLDDRVRKLNLMVDEAEHYWGRKGCTVQNTITLRDKAAKWHDQCKGELHAVHEAARHRKARDLRDPRTAAEPPPGLESTILKLLREDNHDRSRSWLSLLWLTDVHGNYPQVPALGAMPPLEATKAYAALLRNSDAALVQANTIPEMNLIVWLPREACMAARLLAHM